MQDLILLALVDLVLVFGYMFIPLISVFNRLFQQLVHLHLLQRTSLGYISQLSVQQCHRTFQMAQMFLHIIVPLAKMEIDILHKSKDTCLILNISS